MTRFCRIRITQKKSEPAGKGLFGDARHEFLPTLLEDDEEENKPKKPDAVEKILEFFQASEEAPSCTELTTFGALMKEKDGLRVCYQGSEISEGEGATVIYSLQGDTLTFFCHFPGEAEAIKKILPADAELPPEPCLIFQKNRPTLCLFRRFPDAAFFTEKLESDLSFEKGGKIELEYRVVIGGVTVQKCGVTVAVEI